MITGQVEQGIAKVACPCQRTWSTLVQMSDNGCDCAQGRGTVITGRVEQGIVKVGDEIELVGIQGKPTKTVVTGQHFRRTPGSQWMLCLVDRRNINFGTS